MSIARGRPYGEVGRRDRLVRHSRLERTLRAEGRPPRPGSVENGGRSKIGAGTGENQLHPRFTLKRKRAWRMAFTRPVKAIREGSPAQVVVFTMAPGVKLWKAVFAST